MPEAKTRFGMTISDVAKCCKCHHGKAFHGPDGCIPITAKQEHGDLYIVFGKFDACDCKEFDNRFIHVMGDSRRFHSVAEAREAGAICAKN